MDRKSGGTRPDLAQAGLPLIGVIILSLGLWAVLWQSVTSLASPVLNLDTSDAYGNGRNEC